MATSDDYSAVNVRYSGPVTGHQPTPLCGADDCGQPVQLPSNSYCLQCAQWFCSRCLKEHNRFRLFKGHTLTDKPAAGGSKHSKTDPEEQDRPTSRPYSRCQTHGQKKEKFFCKQCSTAMCSKCLASHDSSHEFTKIEPQVEKMMSELRKKRKEIEDGVGWEQKRAAELEDTIKSFGDQKAEEERRIEAVRRDLVDRRKLVEAAYSDAIQQNRTTADDFSAEVQKQLDDVKNKIRELKVFIKRVDDLDSDEAKFTQTDVVHTVIPTVSGPEHDVIPPPQLLTHWDVRHGTDVGCQVTLASSSHSTVRFRRRVAEIQPDTEYYSDESTVGHVPWSINVYRCSDGRLGVWLCSDRHGTLSADFKADVEFSARILHPTEPEKHVISGKRTNTFKRRSHAGWWQSNQLCSWQDVVRRGLAHDGYLTIEIEVKVKQLTFMD